MYMPWQDRQQVLNDKFYDPPPVIGGGFEPLGSGILEVWGYVPSSRVRVLSCCQ